MKKNVLSVALLMMSGFAFAQVGIGTANPNPAALLDVEATKGSFKGVLIPRIPLESATSNGGMTGGQTPNSLLVFNTTSNQELKPGYYFWFDKQWVRLLSSSDDFLKEVAVNEELAVNLTDQTLFLRDTKQGVVSVPLADINIVTTLESNGQGKYIYTSEDQTTTVIDVTADVIENIQTIINEEGVINEIIQSISVNAKALTGDESIEVVGGEKAVLTAASLSIRPSSITTAKIAPGGAKQLLITDENSTVKWVDASDEVIQEAFEFNEKVTLLVDGGDGTFTYYNEKGVDADGNPITGQGVKFDANTLRIEKTADNTYAFFDKSDDTTPIAIIDVAGSVIENITEIINDTTVQNDIYTAVAAQGKAATAADGSIQVDNGDQAVLNAMQLSVANAGITTAKIAPGGAKQLLVTDENGTVKWVDASDEVIQEAFEFNEKVTLLVDGGDGTFTYYNEKGIDADGNPVTGQGVKFDANTLRIEKTADNTYAFFDKSDDTTPIAIIDVAGSVIENITEIINDTTVQNDIYTAVAAQGKAATAADGSIQVDNGDQAVLNAMQLSVANAGITTAKIAPGGAKQLLVTDENGTVKWVDASDEVIQEAFEFNEKVTLLVDGGDGTFTYYNEKGIDADGNPITGQGVKFDANTLNIKEREGASGKGIYDFYDGKTSQQSPLMTINTRAKAIIFENNSTSIPGDNLQDVVNQLITKVEQAQGTLSPILGEGILINEQSQVNDAVLKELTLSLAEAAVTETKLADEAVTSYKLKNKAVTLDKINPGRDQYILVTKEGKAQWVPATDSIIQEVVKQHEVITLIENNGNGTYSYYNEDSIDATGAPIPAKGILLDANTLSISEQPKGTYIFTDGTFTQTGLPLATIDIAGTVIENITEILNDSIVQQDIYTTVAAQGKPATAADGSIQVDQGDQAVLNAMQLSVANAGITTAKIAPGGNKQLLVTNEAGTVAWVDVTDEVIQEAFAFNEKITLLVDGGDGTFTYYNEKGIDADGDPITGQGVKFDANTLRIDKTAENTYAFYDKSNPTTPIAVIDVAGSVIENITEILNDTTVQNDIYTAVAAQGKAVTSPDTSITIGGTADKAALHALELSIATAGVSTTALAPKAVTTEKIQGGTQGQFLVTPTDGVAQWMSLADDPIKELLALNQAITELIDHKDGTFTYFNEGDYDANGDRKSTAVGTTFSANTLRVAELNDPQSGQATGVYAFYDLSQEDPIATINVAGTVIENITTILTEEEVQNQIFATVAAKGKKIHSNDNSIAITGGNKAALSEVIVNIQQEGVKTNHLASGAVTTDKINALGVDPGAVLTADGLGQAAFETPSNVVRPAMQGDLEGEAGVINIVGGGENVLFGDTTKKVTIAINSGGITGTHIGSETIGNQNIKNKTIEVQKLDATGATAGHVATVNANGTVSYQPVTPAVIGDKGDITTDGIVSVSDGIGKVLDDVVLGITDQSIVPSKLDATGAIEGAVAMANGDGTVTYKPLEATAITAKGNITTDGIVTVDNGTGKVLADVVLGIEDGGITNDKIALNTLTIDKLSAGNEPPSRVLVIDENREIKWGELDDVVTDAAGNLTTDGIIELQNGNGVNSLFNDVKLGIKEGSITNTELQDQTIQIGKLNSAGAVSGMVMVTNANGGFTYVDRESIVQAGEDLTLSNELEFLAGSNGVSAVLADTKIGVKDQGITEAKLADGAVTTAKISAVGEDENAVLTADGLGNVAYKKINTTAFEGAEADLKSDGSITIPLNNKAVLRETTLAIANQGVENKHIKDQTVTATKIDAQTAAPGAVLTADGSGKAVFQRLEEVALTQGQAVTSSDGSIAVPQGNKAVLQAMDISVADGGITNEKIEAKAVTEDKIGSNKAAGFVLTSDGEGGAEFKTLGQVIGNNGKAIIGEAAIAVTGGEHAALADVTLDVKNGGITAAKLAANAVTSDKLKNGAVTAAKISGDAPSQILGTDGTGAVKWMSSNDPILQMIVSANEKSTQLVDHQDGTFTYYNEDQIEANGALKPNATGVTFNANTLSIDTSEAGIFIFKDKASDIALATVNTRAKAIIFEDNSVVGYTNVEEAITQINQKIEALEQLEIAKAPLSGNGILVNGNANVADAVFTAVELSIAEEAVSPVQMKGGNPKQLLITNGLGKAEWVDATHEIIEEIVQTQEKVTLVQNNHNGTFTYFNENDVNNTGEIIGTGVTFDANTLRIDTTDAGTFVFYDQATDTPLATIDVAGSVIENITEILNESTVQNDIYTTVAAQGKKVEGDSAIAVTGGETAALTEMGIALRDQGVTTTKIKNLAVTADKLYAGENKANHVPVAQADGSIVYQPMAAVVNGKALTVDTSLAIIGDASKAVLQPFSLQVNENGIETTHIQNQAVTVEKINAVGIDKGAVLTADGSGNAVFSTAEEAVTSAMQGDLVGAEGLIVEGGENVLFGNEETKAIVKINNGGIQGKHIGAATIANNHLVDHTIEAAKLNAGTGADNRIAVANATGQVAYQVLSTELFTEKGDITTDGTITVSENGVGKVLADVELGIKDSSIQATKLNANNAPAGAVATVGANGVSVSFEPLSAGQLANKGNITTDEALTVTEDGIGKVLSHVTLGVKNKGITTAKLADGAVTNTQLGEQVITANKLSSEGISAQSVLLSGENGTVVWGELGEIVDLTAGNLTTDNIIQMSGDGERTLLKDVNLSIANNSITKDKLNSATIARDYILVTDGTGGFDYVLKSAVQAGGEDLTLGSGLAFTGDTDGLNAVLAPTTIDIKEGGVGTDKLENAAVTVEKMNAGQAVANAVLTAQGDGTVSYKLLSNTVFDGQGVDLVADESIVVTADNKALLQEATIAVASSGIDNKHLKALAVTADKISSVVAETNTPNGSILASDGQGNTQFQSLGVLATTAGKSLTSTDGSLHIPTNKATLQDVTINIAENGVKTKHLMDRNITEAKIGTSNKESGLVLTTDGQGGASFQNVNDAVVANGKALQGGTGITVSGTGANQALLQDATVAISNGGVGSTQLATNSVITAKIADKNVTTSKISSKVGSTNAAPGLALTADGSGGVVFSPVTSSLGDLSGSASIAVTNGIGAVLQDVTVTVKDNGIKTAQLDDNAVTTDKIIAGAVTREKIENDAINNDKVQNASLSGSKLRENTITASKLQAESVTDVKIKDGAVTTTKINNLAVTNIKIANNTITGGKLENGTIQTGKLADGAVTTEKISAGNAQRGHVLTVESNGNVAFKAPTGQSITKKELKGSDVIKVTNGRDAVLEEVTLDINSGSIKGNHLDYGAVDSAELADNAVGNEHIQNESVTSDKISSVDEEEVNTPEGYVLTSDGSGGAAFRPAKGGGGASFFYSPSFVVDIIPGSRGEENVYMIYKNQFTNAISSRSSASLDIYDADELDYFIVYYDDDVFEDVSINESGVLTYKVQRYAQVTARSYFNVVMKLRED
ncbi:beta strand repeat-containing protein [Myroides sp. C15-4]|uniref:beta strand repeat-containing protein n=1 Tax=Myroides sp. C15-4 TaxID=3400532 RepID=UPI003D2F7AAC